MSKYTIGKDSNSGSNYSSKTHNCNHRDRSDFNDNSSGGRINNGLTKSTWFPSAASNLENKYNHSNIFPDGPMAISFEKYVHDIFRPGNKLLKLSSISGSSLSAHSMLRVQDLLGPAALNECCKLSDMMKESMEKMFNEHGLTENKNYLFHSSYPTNHVSSIYSSNVLPSPFQSKDSYSSYREKASDDWKRNNKQMIIDYKGSDITPLTPYMYAGHPYVHSQDSRIVCSNFVQITSRPKDRFLEKIDRTLAEVRAMPRF